MRLSAWPDAFGIAQSLLTLGQLSARDSDIDQATAHLMRALDLLKEVNTDHDYDFYVTEMYASLGQVYTSAGDRIKAPQYLNSAPKTATIRQIRYGLSAYFSQDRLRRCNS
jgi:tetratricopeptide (TPR) repeat protein